MGRFFENSDHALPEAAAPAPGFRTLLAGRETAPGTPGGRFFDHTHHDSPPADSARPGAATPAADPDAGDQAAARSLYDAPAEQRLGVAVREIEQGARESSQDAAPLVREWVETFDRFAVPPDEAAELVGAARAVMRSPEWAEAQAATWPREARSALEAEFGADGAAQALDDARAFVAQHPDIADFLDRTGLGDHPRVVRLVARRAAALKRR